MGDEWKVCWVGASGSEAHQSWSSLLSPLGSDDGLDRDLRPGDPKEECTFTNGNGGIDVGELCCHFCRSRSHDDKVTIK